MRKTPYQSTYPFETNTEPKDSLRSNSIIYSSWFRNQIWNGQFDYVIRELKDYNDDLKNANAFQNPIRKDIIFDKSEDQTYSNNIVVGVVALVMYHCRQMTFDDLKSMTFRVVNCYRSIFSKELIEKKIQELLHSNILQYSKENSSIIVIANNSDDMKLSELLNLCIPYLSRLK